MKKILITGANSYIGTAFEKWCKCYEREFYIDTLEVRSSRWKTYDFSSYDTILHVAGIVHKKADKASYYEVNTKLAYNIAIKSKKEGVKQFILLSSMSVYGKRTGSIRKEEVPAPVNYYSSSKWYAEQKIAALEDQTFKLVILRPPMVYGENCKGNYQRLKMLAKKGLIFPDYNNKRSMIYIQHLTEFIAQIIKKEQKGLFCPRNKEDIGTAEMAKYIAMHNNRPLYLVKGFNLIIKVCLRMKIPLVEKVFGTLVYKKENDFELLNKMNTQETIMSAEGLKL